MLTAAIAAPKISFETFAMISFSASGLCYRRAEDWITPPQIPSGANIAKGPVRQHNS
jgi:hypothetical protein